MTGKNNLSNNQSINIETDGWDENAHLDKNVQNIHGVFKILSCLSIFIVLIAGCFGIIVWDIKYNYRYGENLDYTPEMETRGIPRGAAKISYFGQFRNYQHECDLPYEDFIKWKENVFLKDVNNSNNNFEPISKNNYDHSHRTAYGMKQLFVNKKLSDEERDSTLIRIEEGLICNVNYDLYLYDKKNCRFYYFPD